jgi:PIN domain nuclease of toxin-antitoxin system
LGYRQAKNLIALDTHAWIWYATDDRRLSRHARMRIRREKSLGVHPVSCWEVAMLSRHGQLKLSMPVDEWVQAALARPRIELLPLLPSAAVRAAGLGGDFPEDPADRLIVATALEMRMPLVTRDTGIEEWGGIETVWS